MNYREAGRSPHPGPYQAPNFAWADHTGTSGRASPPASCAPAAALATSLLVRLVVVGPNYARLLILGTRSNTVRSSAFERRPSLADSRRPHWCRVRLSRSTRGIRFPLDLVGTARESGNACHGRTGLRSALHRLRIPAESNAYSGRSRTPIPGQAEHPDRARRTPRSVA